MKFLCLVISMKSSQTSGKVHTFVHSCIKRIILIIFFQLCQVTSPGMLTVLLKHVHQMLPYAVCFPNIASKFLSRLVSLWSSEADVVRVLSFLCLLRIANLRRILLSYILKVSVFQDSAYILPVILAWQWRKIIRWDPSAFINNRKG